MANPFIKPTLLGYNPAPAPDTGRAGGSANIIRWSKHTNEIGDPLRDWIQAGFDSVEDAFESIFGTAQVHLLFRGSTAPAGWTQDININDRVLRLVSGPGGGTGGSWTISGLTVPNHNHGAGNLVTGASNSNDFRQGTGTPDNTADDDHTHSISGTTSGSGTLSVSSNGSWRPSFLDIISAHRTFA